MFTALLFAAGAALVLVALQHGGLGLLWLWPAASVLVVAAGYAGLGPRVFGKRRSGALGSLSSVALLPYVVYTWAIWHLVRLLSREPAVDRLTDDIRIGRRLLPREVPDDVAAIVDLTCELPEPAGVMRGRVYRSIPILDGTAPPVDRLATAAIDAKALPRPVLVHCAQGHGRTGMFAIAMLLVEGTASSAEEALELLRAARPGARLNAAQHRVVESLASRAAR